MLLRYSRNSVTWNGIRSVRVLLPWAELLQNCPSLQALSARLLAEVLFSVVAVSHSLLKASSLWLILLRASVTWIGSRSARVSPAWAELLQSSVLSQAFLARFLEQAALLAQQHLSLPFSLLSPLAMPLPKSAVLIGRLLGEASSVWVLALASLH